MGTIYLGQSGSEVTLQPINWRAGGDREIPTGLKKNVEKVTTLDGGTRGNFKSKSPRTWTLEWDILSLSNLQSLITLAALNELLRYQNNDVDSTWRWVWIVSLDWGGIGSTYAGTVAYHVTIELEEAV